MKSVMACTHGVRDPAARFRVVQYIPHLERLGWRVAHRPNRPARPGGVRSLLPRPGARALRRLLRLRDVSEASRFDVVFQNRDLLGGQLAWERRLYARNPRVIFDFDDAIHLGRGREEHLRWICRNAAWVTAGNELLADFARQETERVTLLPTVIDTDRYGGRGGAEPAPPVRVGWCGSDRSIRETLFPHLPLFARLQEQLGFAFVIVSNAVPPPPSSSLRWSFVPWSEGVERSLADQMDIGVMPLLDEPFQRGKCGAKLLQYMGAGLPAVASPVGVNREIVLHAGTGFLAGSPDEWASALRTLILDPEARRRLGDAGRARCEERYSVRAWLPVLAGLLDRVARSPAGEGVRGPAPRR